MAINTLMSIPDIIYVRTFHRYVDASFFGASLADNDAKVVIL